ncbi:MAG: nitronate monooxygenase [Dehalococcoidia bacterium]|nr:nitronate monooxygenase [Dehalococcoidia bacterium]
MALELRTRVTELLGSEYPIVMGTMGYQSNAELVAAAVNAGAFACLASAMFRSGNALRAEIRRTRSLTDRPFGLNINLFPMVAPISNEEYLGVALEEGIRVIETSGRNPEPLVGLIKQGNARMMHKCVSARHARTAERLGADVIEIVGYEAAGHPGRDPIGTMVLIPSVVDAVGIPVVAGGGIADARGVLAAFALGAEGVLMGSRFLATLECPIHPGVKKRLLEAAETDTTLTLYSKGDPMRALRNQLTERIQDMEKRGASWAEVIDLIGGGKGKKALAAGEADSTLVSCGQAVGLIHDIPSIRELLENIVRDAAMICQRLGTGAARVGSNPAPA